MSHTLWGQRGVFPLSPLICVQDESIILGCFTRPRFNWASPAAEFSNSFIHPHWILQEYNHHHLRALWHSLGSFILMKLIYLRVHCCVTAWACVSTLVRYRPLGSACPWALSLWRCGRVIIAGPGAHTHTHTHTHKFELVLWDELGLKRKKQLNNCIALVLLLFSQAQAEL